MSKDSAEKSDSLRCSTLTTQRFDIFRTEVECRGTQSTKIMYHAWFHSADAAKPACVVTISDVPTLGYRFVEWISTDEQHRREGIATEVLRAIEASIGELCVDGATDAGDAFCEAYLRGGDA
jgi:hypothetical protein